LFLSQKCYRDFLLEKVASFTESVSGMTTMPKNGCSFSLVFVESREIESQSQGRMKETPANS
jgi:hypothetical protein